MGEEMKIPREFFTLQEASEKLSLTVPKLLDLAATGNLVFSVLFKGKCVHVVRSRDGKQTATPDDEYKGFLPIPASEASKFLIFDKVKIEWLEDDTLPEEYTIPIGVNSCHPEEYYGIAELCISLSEFSRVHPELTRAAPQQVEQPIPLQDNLKNNIQTGEDCPLKGKEITAQWLKWSDKKSISWTTLKRYIKAHTGWGNLPRDGEKGNSPVIIQRQLLREIFLSLNEK